MMIEVLGREEFDALRDKDSRVHWFVLNEPYTYMVGQEKRVSPIREIVVSLTSTMRELKGDHFETHILKTGIRVGETIVGTPAYNEMMEKAAKIVKESWPNATWGRWD